MEHYKRKFTKLYDKNIDKIYRFVFLKVSSHDSAEDITAQVFTKGWKKFKSGESIDNTQAYLFQIARAEIANYYRKESRYKIIPTEFLEIVGDDPSPEQAQELKSDIKEVEDLLSQLKEEYQDILILRYIDDYSISEIALMLDKSEGAVRTTTHRALKALKAKVDKSVTKLA